MCEALAINTALTSLDLGGDKMEGEKKTLPTEQKIIIRFSVNRLGNEGARMIGEVLKTNSTLTSLDLSGDYLKRIQNRDSLGRKNNKEVQITELEMKE